MGSKSNVAVVGYASVSELVNTAILNGVSVTSAVTIVGYSATGVSTTISSGLSCVSSNVTALKVGSSTCSVSLDGTETSNAVSMNVVASAGGLSMAIVFRVWTPATPITLQLGVSTLHAIENWSVSSGSSCVQGYERTTLSASASFSYDSSSATVLDVTSLIVNSLHVGNGSVVAVSGTTG